MSYDIEWLESVDGESHFRQPNPEKDIDYKNWQTYVIPDKKNKKKLDRIAVEVYKKRFYILAYELGAKVKFDIQHYYRYDNSFRYIVSWYIYNIPTDEKVVEIYKYVDKKGGRGFIKSAIANYDRKYKYELFLRSKAIKVSSSAIKSVNVPHSEVSGVYDYEEAKRRFGDFKGVIHEVTYNGQRIHEIRNAVYIEAMKKYKTEITEEATADFVYKIINIPYDKPEGRAYINKVKESLKKSNKFYHIDVDKSTMEIMINAGWESWL